jgi:uncharacterized phage protein gp47/JayE
MALPQIPTATEIYNRIIIDITGKINQGVPSLPLSFVKVLAKAVAGVCYLKYFAILWVYKQIFPQTADYETKEKMGAIVGLYPDPAVSAILLCTIPGITGQWVYSGELFIGANGVVYRVTTSTEIIAGEATAVPLLALTSGEIGNLEIGETLDIIQTNLSLTGTAEVTSISTTGSEKESEESFGAVVIARYRRRITGGSPADYYFWGLECPNFDWIGVYATVGYPSVVTIYGHVDNQTDGIPTAPQLVELEDYLTNDPVTGKAWRKPTNDTLDINATDVLEYDIELTIRDGNLTVKTDIETEIRSYVPTLRPFIEGISDIKNNSLASGDLIGIANDIASESDSKVTVCEITRVSGSVVQDEFILTGGVMAKVRNLTWVDI